MLNVKEELSYLINFFKIFGLFLENFKKPTIKCLKFLKFWPMEVYVIHIVTVFGMTIQEIYNWTQIIEKIFWEKYPGIFMKSWTCMTGSLNVFLIFVNRRHELKFWELISQLDDFIVRFLGIEYNQRRENWQHIGRTLFCILLAFLIGTILSEAGFSTTDNYERFYSSSFYFLLLKQWNVHRYIFYVTVLSNRIKILI